MLKIILTAIFLIPLTACPKSSSGSGGSGASSSVQEPVRQPVNQEDGNPPGGAPEQREELYLPLVVLFQTFEPYTKDPEHAGKTSRDLYKAFLKFKKGRPDLDHVTVIFDHDQGAARTDAGFVVKVAPSQLPGGGRRPEIKEENCEAVLESVGYLSPHEQSNFGSGITEKRHRMYKADIYRGVVGDDQLTQECFEQLAKEIVECSVSTK